MFKKKVILAGEEIAPEYYKAHLTKFIAIAAGRFRVVLIYDALWEGKCHWMQIKM